MTPADEHILYQQDIRAWARYVAPRRAAMLSAAPDDEAKRELWRAFGEESRRAIRELKEGA
jgi:hypothetical protein